MGAYSKAGSIYKGNAYLIILCVGWALILRGVLFEEYLFKALCYVFGCLF